MRMLLIILAVYAIGAVSENRPLHQIPARNHDHRIGKKARANGDSVHVIMQCRYYEDTIWQMFYRKSENRYEP